MENNSKISELGRIYDKYHKLLFVLPAILIILAIGYLVYFNSHEGDIIYKDVSLTGGTTISVFDEKADVSIIKEKLKTKFPDVIVREISDIRSGRQRGFFVESKAQPDELKKEIEGVLGYELNSKNSSIEFSGSSLSQGFYQQLKNAVIASFLLMSWVIFFVFVESKKIKAYTLMISASGVVLALQNVSFVKIFGGIIIFGGFVASLFSLEKKKRDFLISFGIVVASLIAYIYPKEIFLFLIVAVLIYFYAKHSVPSIAVIGCAFADIVLTIVVANLLKMQLSSAGIVALLMLIGYSVDTDVLLTTRVLKHKEESLNKRIFGAFKTGITMTLTSIGAIGVALIFTYSLSDTLRQIFSILLIGLFFDMFNTWVTNAAILKMYAEGKKIS